MIIRLQIDPFHAGAMTDILVNRDSDYAAIGGGPFTSLTHHGQGLYDVDIGAQTGEWIIRGRVGADVVYSGFASSEHLSSGRAVCEDFRPWLAGAVSQQYIRTAVGLDGPDLDLVVNSLVGHVTWTYNGDNTWNVAIRNADNTVTLRTVRFSPYTGNKSIVS